MHTNTFPHSPDLESAANVQPLIKESKSPLSLLAHELEFLGRGSGNSITSSGGLGKDRTPRRSLLSQLTATAFNSGIADIHREGSLICDLTVNIEQTRSATKLQGTRIFSSPLAEEIVVNSSSFSEDSSSSNNSFLLEDLAMGVCDESDSTVMKVDDDPALLVSSSSSGQFLLATGTQATSSFVAAPMLQGSTVIFKPSAPVKPILKFRDQNGIRPPRGPATKFDPRPSSKSVITSHWNSRKPLSSNANSTFIRHKTMGMAFTKKREGDTNSPNKFSVSYVKGGGGRSIIKQEGGGFQFNNPRKIRRAMTFSGAAPKECDTMDSDSSEIPPILPSFIENGKDMLRRITSATLAQVLSGAYADKIDEFYLIDCRYPFEYQGGHIKSATNINQAADLQANFFANPVESGKRVVIVFHCEYSVQRAPQMALYFRGIDRNINKERYPFLNYPDIYILQGGYRDFYQQQLVYCDPQSYVEMNDARFEKERKISVCAQNRDFPKMSAGFFH